MSVLASEKARKETKLAGLLSRSGQSLMVASSGVSAKSTRPVPQSLALINGVALAARGQEEHHILAQAQQQDLPIVIENASAAVMQQVTGLGVAADVAVVRRLGPNRRQIVLLGGTAVTMQEQGEQQEATGQKVAGLEQSPVIQETAAVGMTPEEIVTQVQATLAQPVAMVAMATASSQEAEATNKYIYYVTIGNKTLRSLYIPGPEPVRRQEAYLAIDFEVGLYATNNPTQKWLRIRPTGVGFSPTRGTAMLYDENIVRGYFQDHLVVTYGPKQMPPGFAIDDYAPRNVNADYSVTNSTGFEVGPEIGKDGPAVSANYSASKSTTRGFKDFKLTDATDGTKGIWHYKLSGVGEGKEYSQWSDLWYYYVFDWGMYTLPSLATGPLKVDSEVVWRAPETANQKVAIDYSFMQTIRVVWLEGAYIKTDSYSNTFANSFTVDFSLVKIPTPPQPEMQENGRSLAASTMTLASGNARALTVSSSRVGGNIASLQALSLPPFANFRDNGNGTGTLSLQPTITQEGRFQAIIRATSPEGLYTDQTFTFDVVNHPPQLEPIGDQMVEEGKTLAVPIRATDVDGHPVQLAVEGLPLFAKWIDNGDGSGNISCTPNYENSGRYAMTVVATDSGGKTAQEAFTLTVRNVNRAPLLEPIGPISANEGSSLVKTIRASDPDRQIASLKASGLPRFATFTDKGKGLGELKLQPNYKDAGLYHVTITTTDPEGATDKETFSIRVFNVLRPLPTEIQKHAFERDKGLIEIKFKNWLPGLALQVQRHTGAGWANVMNDTGGRGWFHESLNQNDVIRYAYGLNVLGSQYRWVIYDKAEGLNDGWAVSETFTIDEMSKHIVLTVTLPAEIN